MRLTISHSTRYNFGAPVTFGLQQLRLTPKSRIGQTVLRWQTMVNGGKKQTEYHDQHNNTVNLIKIEPGVEEITIQSQGEVDTSNTNGVLGAHGGWAPLWYFTRSTALTQAGQGVADLIGEYAGKEDMSVARLHDLSAKILNALPYGTGDTDVKTTAEEALKKEHGVCQDHTHIFVAAARELGFPARYVSGYLMMRDDIEQNASHAWAEVHVEGLGWVGFDVSNQISPDEGYVAVATGLDYSEAAPISGLNFGSGKVGMSVSLQVQQQ